MDGHSNGTPSGPTATEPEERCTDSWGLKALGITL